MLAFGLACRSLGAKPSEERIKKYLGIENYNAEKKIFFNRLPELVPQMQKRLFRIGLLREVLLGGSRDRVPAEKLPEQKPDLAAMQVPASEIRLVWFGHSSFLLRMAAKNILLDPIFSSAASPLPIAVRRFQEPVVPIESLPEIDFVVISHDHYDHLDRKTIEFFRNKTTQFIVPLGVGSHLEYWGIASERITERAWWQSHQVGELEFIATPAQHFSGRSLRDRDSTLWASWVIRDQAHRLYFSGDSGYDIHFKEIGERFGPFDVAFIENGQYNERWREVHMMPEDSIQAARDLGTKAMFPIHWGMFELSIHAWYEPIEEALRLSRNEDFDLLAPQIGQVIDPLAPFDLQPWWQIPKRREKK